MADSTTYAQFVTFEQTGSIARITLNRPEKLNAIDYQVGAELYAGVRALRARPEHPGDRAGGRRPGVLRRRRARPRAHAGRAVVAARRGRSSTMSRGRAAGPAPSD